MHSPEKGFYYHYKHSPDSIFHGSYEVIGTAINTEDIAEHFVVYRPLYEESLAYQQHKSWWVRPLGMFAEDVTKDGKTFPRFTRITDPAIIAMLEQKRDEMYRK